MLLSSYLIRLKSEYIHLYSHATCFYTCLQRLQILKDEQIVPKSMKKEYCFLNLLTSEDEVRIDVNFCTHS